MLRRSILFADKNSRRFVDNLKILLSSGTGGDGASIMAHEHGNEFAGPGGGNGGNGGNIMIKCTKDKYDLSHIKQLGAQLKAPDGRCGYAREAHGKRGKDLWLEVPLGTEIIDVDTNEVVYDMNEVGMEVLLLEGGQGGKGNAAFANKWHHSPIESTRGLPGNTMLAQLELKSIADCGLIGYPNAGKSSLLSAISSSKPAIAPYAFTTLRPYIGILHDLYGNTCRIADIPGLMEGAYENRGLGHQFLRHVERTKTLAFVVDMHSTYTPDPKEPSMEPWEVVELLQCELEYYLPNLSERAIMVFANKMDQEVDIHGRPLTDKLKELEERVTLPVFPVSAALGIALGVEHKQTGLSDAIRFMCHRVFESKNSEREILQKRRASEEMQLQKVFEYKNNGIFSFEDAEDDDSASTGNGQSLVDQQLDQLGFSGLGENFDGYEHSIARNKLHEYRDLTMKGKYWRLTRQKGESLKSEKWK